jgi:hypothetical protein
MRHHTDKLPISRPYQATPRGRRSLHLGDGFFSWIRAERLARQAALQVDNMDISLHTLFVFAHVYRIFHP